MFCKWFVSRSVSNIGKCNTPGLVSCNCLATSRGAEYKSSITSTMAACLRELGTISSYRLISGIPVMAGPTWTTDPTFERSRKIFSLSYSLEIACTIADREFKSAGMAITVGSSYLGALWGQIINKSIQMGRGNCWYSLVLRFEESIDRKTAGTATCKQFVLPARKFKFHSGDVQATTSW